MKIIAYQIMGTTCRFAYQKSEVSLEVVTVENTSGMIDFLLSSDGRELAISTDINNWAKEQEERVKSFDMFEVLNKIW